MDENEVSLTTVEFRWQEGVTGAGVWGEGTREGPEWGSCPHRELSRVLNLLYQSSDAAPTSICPGISATPQPHLPISVPNRATDRIEWMEVGVLLGEKELTFRSTEFVGTTGHLIGTILHGSRNDRSGSEVKARSTHWWVIAEGTGERVSAFLEWLLRKKSKGPGSEGRGVLPSSPRPWVSGTNN